jgi:hypothetical protein
MQRILWVTGPLLLGCSLFDSTVTGVPLDPGGAGMGVGGASAGTPSQPASGGNGGGGVVSGGAGGTAGSGGTAVGSGGTTAEGGAPSTGAGPLCDVLALMRAKCQSCHSPPPRLRSVPMALATYDDLVAPAPTDAQMRTIDMSIERMQDTMAPMPPAPADPATAADVAVLQAWIDAGSPATCDTGTAGAGGDGSVVPPNPYDTPVVCTSNAHWTGGNAESANMHPGAACINCHASGEGPRFTFAGTVYPSAHEPTDCNGLNGPSATSQVIITDASGATFTMSVNSVGNFSYSARTGTTIVLPYHAKVVTNGLERAMSAAQQSGDCNTCHSESGDKDAPGRIMSP